jgi:hypothetical protein
MAVWSQEDMNQRNSNFLLFLRTLIKEQPQCNRSSSVHAQLETCTRNSTTEDDEMDFTTIPSHSRLRIQQYEGFSISTTAAVEISAVVPNMSRRAT